MPETNHLTLYKKDFVAMGTQGSIQLYAETPTMASFVFERAIQEIHRIETRYSRYRQDSLVTEINRTAAAGASILVDEETAGLLDYAFACYRKSDGLFDISSGILRNVWHFGGQTLPLQTEIERLLPFIGLDKVEWHSPRLHFPVAGMELDFGGIGKEYAADQVAAICQSYGVKHGLIDLGGDIVAIGPHPNQGPWQVGIRHPRIPETSMMCVTIDRGALATSGDYERYMDVDGIRYCHLLNPKTGWPQHTLSSVSVFSEQCLVAGSLSSIALLKGQAGPTWLSAIGAPHVWMNAQGFVHSSLTSD